MRTLIMSLGLALGGIIPVQAASFFKIIERESCNEINIFGSADYHWSMSTGGGSFSVKSGEFKDLKDDQINNVGLDKEQTVNLILKGKAVVPDSLSEEQRFGLDFQRLISPNYVTFGRALFFLDHKNQFQITDKDGPAERKKILLAAFYFNFGNQTTKNVPCHYIAGELDPNQEERSGSCFWLDSKSKGKNGKHYCW
jgi:hypothetical protein